MTHLIKKILYSLIFLMVSGLFILLFLRLQGIQYLMAYTRTGFAKELPKHPRSPYSAQQCHSTPIRVLTYNVEYGSEFIESMAATFTHGSTGGALPWSVRLPEIRERIASYAPDLIGLQETQTDTDIAMIVSLQNYQLHSYHLGKFHYGDAALLFKKDKFELLDSGQLWLSPTPYLPMSLGFKPLSMVRYVNWARLKEKQTNFVFMFVNTHFDNAGVNKEPSATLFRDSIASLTQQLPIIVTGDFNTKANTERYQRLIGVTETTKNAFLINTHSLSPISSTLTKLHPNERIDHIFVGGPCQITANNWLIDTQPLKNGQRLSDHDPIRVDVQFN
jgi:endonuclease/exonuclease/phosphatase family metal-dependent hydrolase